MVVMSEPFQIVPIFSMHVQERFKSCLPIAKAAVRASSTCSITAQPEVPPIHKLTGHSMLLPELSDFCISHSQCISQSGGISAPWACSQYEGLITLGQEATGRSSFGLQDCFNHLRPSTSEGRP